MSELIQKNDNRATIRWKLLTGASALALTVYISSAAITRAEDASQPQIWIELSGQLNRLQDSQEIYAPLFLALTPTPFTPPQKAERPPLYSINESAALTFQPKDSDWTFSASVQYGRAGSGKLVRHQTYPQLQSYYLKQVRTKGTKVKTISNYRAIYPTAARFTDADVKQSENHAILDFQAAKDVGLGLFGHDASSTLSVGVRIAQFKSNSRTKLEEDPDWQFKTNITHYSNSYTSFYGGPIHLQRTRRFVHQLYHSFAGSFRADRSFSGLGPSLSWSSSVPFAGNSQNGALAFDWGVNAALLFGRQKAKTSHQTTARYHSSHAYNARPTTVYHHPVSATAYHSTRSRNITVPNVGGFAGISFNYPGAKVRFGYRADWFFNAIDGGIDARKSENRAFYGPYASISIGLGD